MARSGSAGPQAASRQVLAFRVGERRLALPASQVAEVLRPPAITRVPHAPVSLLGVANLRGEVMPVIALARLLGDEEGQTAARSRVVVLDRAPPIGLAVDEVSDLAQSGEASGAQGLTVLEDGVARLIDLDALLKQAFAIEARPQRKADSRPEVAAPADATPQISVLGFSLAGQAYALPLEQVREVLPVPGEIAVLPLSDAAMLGVVALRGALLPIVSTRVLLGLPPQALEGDERIVVIAIGASRIGLLVDRLNAILRTTEAFVGAVPKVLNRGAGEAKIEAILRTGDGGLVSILSAEHLFRDESMRQILEDGRQGDADVSADAEGESDQLLIFQLGDEHYGLPIASVREVVSLPETLTRVPRAPAFVAGVMSLRGELIPVVDQRQRFAVQGAAPKGRQRVIVTTFGELTAGFVVDAVSEILAVPRERQQATPQIAADGSRLFDRVVQVDGDGRMILLVDPREMLDRAEADLLQSMAKASAPS